MSVRGMSWRLAAALLAVTAMVAVFVVLRVSGEADASVARMCARIEAASEARAAVVSGTGPRIVVIGDSYAQGLYLPRAEQSWPWRLPGRVHVDGFAGSGFSTDAGRCPRRAYSARVSRALALDPDLVVLQGGLNEHRTTTDAVVSGARRVLARLGDVPVLVVGPPLAPRRAAAVPRVDAALAAVAEEGDVPYVRTADWQLDYLPDRLHLTVQGHRDFGARVAAAMAPLLRGATAAPAS